MDSTQDSDADRAGSAQHWLDSEVPAADAHEQRRDLVDDDIDPEAPVTQSVSAAGVDADTADVVEQATEVDLDDEPYAGE